MDNRKKEIQEAIDAGNQALRALEDAQRHLGSARGFGIWDIFGGGFISSMIKHSKMNDAQESLNDAQFALQRFSRELQDVNMGGNIQIKFDGLVQFIDIFCDNFLVDVMVQSKIKQTQKNIDTAKRRVREVITQLHNMQSEM